MSGGTKWLAWVLPGLVLAGCSKGRSACGLGGDGDTRTRDDIVTLGDRYDGPAFSELGDLEVVDDVVWFCSSVIGLNAYDASDPARLKKLDDIGFSAGDLVYPRCHHLAPSDDGFVYVSQRANSVSSDSFLATVDGSDATDLVEITTEVRVENVEGLTVHGDHLLVAAHEAGLLVLDREPDGALSDRGALVDGLTNPWQVRARGDLAFIADGEGGLAVVDLSDPSRPALVATLALDGVSKDLALAGDLVYLAAGAAGVHVVDVSDPSAPALVETEDTPGSALALALGTDAVFVADWNDLRVFDRTDPRDLVPRGHEPLTLSPGTDSRTLGIAADGDWLYSGNWTELVSYLHHPDRAGPDLFARPGLLQLGEVEPGSSGDALVEVSNAGTEPLTLDDVQTSGQVLTVDNLPDGPLGPGATHKLQVTFTPKNSRPWDGWLNLLSDDPDQPRRCVRAEANRGGLSIGDPVGELSLVGLDGETMQLSDYQGKAVVLAYFATF